jgi:hypothetical protein
LGNAISNALGVAKAAMRDNPQRIANFMIEELGPERAFQSAMEGAAAAHQQQDNYALSVWREVKLIIGESKQRKKQAEASAEALHQLNAPIQP